MTSLLANFWDHNRGAATVTRVLEKLAIVVPLFDEEAVLPELLRQLRAFRASCGVAVTVTFVDDGSRDRTPELLRAAAAMDPALGVVRLARNFGHQAAISAGLREAKGDAVVIMDGDLQDPPTLIHAMIERYEAGFDVVYARRRDRSGDPIFKRLSAYAFYRVMRAFVHRDLPSDVGDFRLLSRDVADVLNGMRETHRFLRGMVCWLGFRQCAVDFDRPRRHAGKTKFSLRSMAALAIDATLSFSSKPLRLSTYAGLAAIAGGAAFAFYVLYGAVLGRVHTPGWSTLVILITTFGGMILFSIGLLGEYVGRIFEEVKGRPTYVVASRIGASQRTEVVPPAGEAEGRQGASRGERVATP